MSIKDQIEIARLRREIDKDAEWIVELEVRIETTRTLLRESLREVAHVYGCEVNRCAEGCPVAIVRDAIKALAGKGE